MKLQSLDPIFDRVPDFFTSPFPSNDSLLDLKFKELLKDQVIGTDGVVGTLGAQIFTRAQAVAWRDSLALVNKVKYTVVGDIPTQWIPNIAWLDQVRPGVEAFKGLFASVDWSLTNNPQKLAENIATVALDSALGFVGAVPIVGALMKGIVGLGSFMASIFDSPSPEPVKKLFFPWAGYSKNTDEDLVQKFLVDTYAARVDWTNIFMPPFESVPWIQAEGIQNKQKVGTIFAPIKNKEIAYSSSGLGSMPGTQKVAGYIQSPDVPQPDPRLLRYFSDGTMMRWGRVITDTGDFYPAFSQTCTLLWQQAQKLGSSDMYKLDLDSLESAWELYFDTYFESIWNLYKTDEWAGEFAAPYLAVIGGTTRLGIKRSNGYDPIRQPHPAPLITPNIFKDGVGTAKTRNVCLYIEPTEGPTASAGPTSTAQLSPYPAPYKRAGGKIDASGGTALPPPYTTSKGTKCIPWPDGPELLSKYSSPFDAIIKPAINTLRQLQKISLSRSLVCAYVRPEQIQDLPAYAAFKNKNLKDECIRLRKILLQHEDRYQIRLKDVIEIDPEFEKALRDSGVTNSPAQLSTKKGKLSVIPGKNGKQEALDPNVPAPPDPLPPKGGAPFEANFAFGESSEGSFLPLLVGAGLAAMLFIRK